MEFNEKLQYLRKEHGLTQEQLAGKLFVSRTAISKWESRKGYPNIESLKAISKLFSVSIDELLSGDELLSLAETENQTNINTLYGLIFGIFDLLGVAFIFMPLSGQQDGDFIRSVALYSNTDITNPMKVIYFVVLTAISLFGAFEIAVQKFKTEKRLTICCNISIILHTLAILVFALSRQPYLTTFLFLLLMSKVVLIIKKIS